MRGLAGLAVAGVALMILAFNPQLIGSARNTIVGPVEQWTKDGSDTMGAKKLLVKAPKFPDRNGRVAAPEFMRTDLPSLSGQKSSAKKGFGAGAVAVQRAKGL